MENSFPMMNIHEMVFQSFITKECPTFMADKLISLFRVMMMMIFNAGNVNYNAIMISNTLMVDFFMRNHRLLARGLSFGFVEQILFRLLRNDRYWYFLNNLNPHLFYLNYRTKIMNLFCHQMAKLYGMETFHLIFHCISSAVHGREREEYPEALGKSSTNDLNIFFTPFYIFLYFFSCNLYSFLCSNSELILECSSFQMD